MRKKFIAGNWKMNLVPSAAEKLAQDLKSNLSGSEKAEIAVCPPYVALPAVLGVLKGSAISVGAQDMHWEDQGAFTGKISHDMLTDLGCTYVILGHSEQRQYFHETDETVNKKTKKALEHGLRPIVCVGETLEERDANKTNDVVQKQLLGALQGISDLKDTVIAYEPVWAIGTGKNATPEMAQEVHAMIREKLNQMYAGKANDTRILYGGSMKPDNAEGLLKMEDIDGGLIGGASLKADAFFGIIKAANS
tara:strand:+ start:65 stop:814 length:750 start_codon:yes stop_codon:yes gene_type:complete